jgi:hypothetical protein
MCDLFDRWERVWHEGQNDLIPGRVGPTYVRHNEKGDRTVAREPFAAEIAQTRQEWPSLRFVVYDHSFERDRAWFRSALKFIDPKTGETSNLAGMQLCRIEGGKLAETWLMFQQPGSAWPDVRCAGALDELAPVKLK